MIKKKIYIKLLLIIFFISLCYIIFSYIKHFFKSHTNTYQVATGSLKKIEQYRGYIYRDEEIIKSPKDSYCSFIYADQSKLQKDSIILIFTDNNYSNYDFSQIQDKNISYNKISEYNKLYKDNDFYAVYSYKNNLKEYFYDVKDNLYTYTNSEAYKDPGAIKIFSKYSGIISYCIDGYEDIKCNEFETKYIMIKDYHDCITKNFYNANDNVCKIIKSPIYNIVFDSDSDILREYIGKNIIIELNDNKNKVECKLSTYKTNDNVEHYMLTLDKYLEKYLNYRVLDFSIVYKENSGLKIPNSCIYDKNCYIIDKKFVEYNQNDNNYYVYKKLNNDLLKIKVDIFHKDDNNYYIIVDENINLNINDKLSYKDEVFYLINVKSFTGVYCINTGYNVFKIINVLDKNTEYSIVDKNYAGSVKEYDILLLNVDF